MAEWKFYRRKAQLAVVERILLRKSALPWFAEQAGLVKRAAP
jgi:hypothetical protein